MVSKKYVEYAADDLSSCDHLVSAFEKKGIVGTEGRKNMVDLCLFVTLPFNIIHSVFYGMGLGDDGFLRDRIVPVNWI